MKTFTVNTGSYPLKIKIVVSSNEAKVVKYINRKQHRKGYGKCHKRDFKRYLGTFNASEHYNSIIWLRRKPKKAEEYSTLAHEVLHAVIDTMRYVGVKLSADSEEAYTYLHSTIMKQILKNIA